MNFCKYGWHSPLKNHKYFFTDIVSGKEVYHAECSCGIYWMIANKRKYFGFKVKSLIQKGRDTEKFLSLFGK